MGEAVARGVAGQIDPGDRHGGGEIDVLALARGDGRGDRLLVPRAPAHRLRQPGREIVDALHAHAAMAEEAVVAAEIALGRRVVHIDGVLVGHGDANVAERVAAPRILPQDVVGGLFGRPVDRARADLLTLIGQDADVGPAEIAGVALHLGDDLVLDDRGRHGPGRVEIDRLNLGDGLGRGMLDVADDGDVAPRDRSALHRLDRGGGDVDHHIALAEGEHVAGHALGRGDELAEARGGGHVHRLQRRAVDRAGLAQSVAVLEG